MYYISDLSNSLEFRLYIVFFVFLVHKKRLIFISFGKSNRLTYQTAIPGDPTVHSNFALLLGRMGPSPGGGLAGGIRLFGIKNILTHFFNLIFIGIR